MADTLAGFNAKLEQLARDLSGKERQAMLRKVGKRGIELSEKAVRNDIGDQTMSGWPRKKPYDLDFRTDLPSDHEVEVNPAFKARGPVRVLESGRQSYAAGDKRKAGTRTRKKDGATVDKMRKVKRTVGATKGKGTWSDATHDMEKELPRLAAEEFRALLGKRFGG